MKRNSLFTIAIYLIALTMSLNLQAQYVRDTTLCNEMTASWDPIGRTFTISGLKPGIQEPYCAWVTDPMWAVGTYDDYITTWNGITPGATTYKTGRLMTKWGNPLIGGTNGTSKLFIAIKSVNNTIPKGTPYSQDCSKEFGPDYFDVNKPTTPIYCDNFNATVKGSIITLTGLRNGVDNDVFIYADSPSKENWAALPLTYPDPSNRDVATCDARNVNLFSTNTPIYPFAETGTIYMSSDDKGGGAPGQGPNYCSKSFSIKTLTADNQAPTTPTNLVSSKIAQSSLSLSWSPSTDNFDIVIYDLYKDGVLYSSTSSTSVIITGLTPSTNYTFTVKARDNSGNTSSASTVLSVTTLVADLNAPSTPIGLKNSLPSETGFTLQWTASTDNVGVAEYDVLINGSWYTSTSSNQLTIYGLNMGSAYSVTVQAKDSAGNVSPSSAPLVVYTQYSTVPTIGIVGVNKSNKNMVVWNKPTTDGIASFNIYKETTVSGVYTIVGNVLYSSPSLFVDNTSSPDVQSNKYKISAVDKNGIETDLSLAHKTMHLSINKGMGSSWNLNWEPYEGFTVSTYNIYRGTNPNNLSLLGSTSGSSTQYSDLNAPNGYVYYQLGLVSPAIINPSKVSNGALKVKSEQNISSENYDISLSNIATNGPVGINDVSVDADKITIFPNPVKDLLNLTFDGETSFDILNLMGEIVYHGDIKTNATIEASSFQSGVYVIRFEAGNGSYVYKKFIKE
jgi:chitodextrinase